MINQYEIPTCSTTLMCGSCNGIGTLGGSIYLTESCSECNGTGMVQREVEDFTFEEKQNAMDEAHAIMNPMTDHTDWKWQQENTKLQHEIKRLRKEFATYKVAQIKESSSKEGIIFTKQELNFIRENKLNYSRVYALVHRYESVKDALIEVLEGTI